MDKLDRRSALKLGLLAGAAIAAPGTAGAQGQYGLTIDSGAPTGPNPVLFWNGVALDLVALDHSLVGNDIRALGPCATSYALGLVHAAMADAVAYAYENDAETPAQFTAKFIENYTGPIPHPASQARGKELFVAGAAAGILAHIYNTPAHVQLIEFRRQEFFKQISDLNPAVAPDYTAWQNGLAFTVPRDDQGNRLPNEISDRWLWEANDTDRGIRWRIHPEHSDYLPSARRHNVDPYNANQGFYGQRWGSQQPLVLGNTGGDDGGLPVPPEETGSRAQEYEDDLEYVQVEGKLTQYPDKLFDPITLNTKVGLFWAYDGARLIGTPPRLYNQILRNIVGQDKLSVPDTARLLALCNLAMADAGIIAWKAKYHYNVWRPVLGIQNRLDESMSDLCWRPLGAPKTNPEGAGTQPPPSGAGGGGGATGSAQALLGASQSIQSIPNAAEADGGVQLAVAAQSLLGAGPYLLQSEPTGPEPAEGQQRPACGRLGNTEPAFTPNFPAYPSGHATFGSACFHTLRQFREDHFKQHKPSEDHTNVRDALVGFTSDELNGISIDPYTRAPRPRVFVNSVIDETRGIQIVYDLNTITDLIEQNNISRVYLGVHWQFDATEGSNAGLRIAKEVYIGTYTV